MGPNPILLQDIICYGKLILKIDIEDFIDYISALDSVMLKHLYEGNKRND